MLLAISEMCISGKIGAKIKIPGNGMGQHKYLFSEDQSRYLVEIKERNKKEVTKILEKNSIYYEEIGKTQKDYLDLEEEFKAKVTDLIELNGFWFKDYFKENI